MIVSTIEEVKNNFDIVFFFSLSPLFFTLFCFFFFFFFFQFFPSILLSLFSFVLSSRSVFFFSFFPLLFLLPPIFIGKNRGGIWMGAATVLPPLHRPSNTWKVWVVDVFLKRSRRLFERGIRWEQKKKNLLLPLPRASRGKRRPIVPSKQHRFGLPLF